MFPNKLYKISVGLVFLFEVATWSFIILTGMQLVLFI